MAKLFSYWNGNTWSALRVVLAGEEDDVGAVCAGLPLTIVIVGVCVGSSPPEEERSRRVEGEEQKKGTRGEEREWKVRMPVNWVKIV